MNAQIFLIAPVKGETKDLSRSIGEALGATHIAALLLPRGSRDEDDYQKLAEEILPMAHAHGCALLLDDAPMLAKKLGADGVHMSGDIKSLREALKLLKPDMIVGTGAVHSKDEAMRKGEAGVDYVFFGDIDGRSDDNLFKLASWWAETFEIPAIYSDPAAAPGNLQLPDCEFIALSDSIWSSPEGAGHALVALSAK